MITQFSRNELLLGHGATTLLGAQRVAVFGVGGVGSYVVEGLARAGIGHFLIVDNDTVCLSNINRQLIAMHSTIGKCKVAVMKDRILDINPEAEVSALQCFYGSVNADEIDYPSFSYIVDCIDTVSSKILLIEKAIQSGVPIISCMGAGNKLDPTLFEFADIYKTSVCPLARVMRRELKKRNIPALKVLYSREEPIVPDANEETGFLADGACPPDMETRGSSLRQVPGSVSFVPSVAGLMIAGRVIKDLLGLP